MSTKKKEIREEEERIHQQNIELVKTALDEAEAAEKDTETTDERKIEPKVERGKENGKKKSAKALPVPEKSKVKKAVKEKPPKAKLYTRALSLYDSLMAFPEGAEPKKIIKRSAELYGKKRGEEINLKEAERFFYSRTDILFLFDVLTEVDGQIMIKKGGAV